MRENVKQNATECLTNNWENWIMRISNTVCPMWAVGGSLLVKRFLSLMMLVSVMVGSAVISSKYDHLRDGLPIGGVHVAAASIGVDQWLPCWHRPCPK